MGVEDKILKGSGVAHFYQIIKNDMATELAQKQDDMHFSVDSNGQVCITYEEEVEE